jgi:hypothetical protein
MSIVYRKTAKGQSEIETRAFRLLPRLRQALILVDGRRTDDELAQMIFAEPRATLDSLRADGFIEAVAERVVADLPASPAPESAAVPPRRPASVLPVAPAAASASPEALRREAVRYLNDQLGPAAEGIAMKLERAKSMSELRPLLVSAAQLLANVRGAATAQAFSDRFLADPSV